ncbi:hypothetical protein SSX86_000178 [Deinandra increscens subsp. villosa]|uniref:Formin-like protein n=1 Tax=Deinandra increscens subsp. villosa TaxID=3103831 RepID=A0AAP0DW25_9ASTR
MRVREYVLRGDGAGRAWVVGILSLRWVKGGGEEMGRELVFANWAVWPEWLVGLFCELGCLARDLLGFNFFGGFRGTGDMVGFFEKGEERGDRGVSGARVEPGLEKGDGCRGRVTDGGGGFFEEEVLICCIVTVQNYTGDLEKLGKCEQFFLELMKVPRMEAKLNIFLFKIQFSSQLEDLKKNLNLVNSACEEVRKSVRLKEIMKRLLYVGNTLNQGTARGAAVGFKLDSLLKLTDTRAQVGRMTLMHYLCKLLANRSPSLLEFQDDLVSLEAAAKIQLKTLADEMLALTTGLRKAKQELDASANDGPVSEGFHKALKEFIDYAEAEVKNASNFYSIVGKNADGLALYFGEDPKRCPFEQATRILYDFVRLFTKCHEENLKQDEERKKAGEETEMEKAKGVE